MHRQPQSEALLNENRMEKYEQDFYLPDLSSGKAVFMLVLIPELFVLVQMLATSEPFSWSNLALSSLFVQWVVLLCASFAQMTRNHFGNLPVKTASFILLLVVALTTSLFAVLTQSLLFLKQPDWQKTLQATGAAVITAIMVLRYFYIQHQLNVQQSVVETARLDSLQARIRPHFLFNSMNIIASLIRIDPEKAEQAVEDLSDLFRSGLQKNEAIIPIQQEIELSKSYLRIERHRLGQRLQTEWRTNELSPNLTIPSFTIQPLVENAVYHGIQPLEKGGKVTISIKENKNDIQIFVKNPMPIEGTISKGNQIALGNIRSRLRMLYGKDASLTTEENIRENARVFIARITYPAGHDHKLAPTMRLHS